MCGVTQHLEYLGGLYHFIRGQRGPVSQVTQCTALMIQGMISRKWWYFTFADVYLQAR